MSDFYGEDISTFALGTDGNLGLDGTMSPLIGARVVLEACARRLQTRRGMLRGAPDYGFDLVTRVGARISAVGRERLRASIEAECLKDERVRSAKVVKFLSTGDSYDIRISIELASGKFDLVLSVDSVSVTILQSDTGG